jgi:hypothetical protein
MLRLALFDPDCPRLFDWGIGVRVWKGKVQVCAAPRDYRTEDGQRACLRGLVPAASSCASSESSAGEAALNEARVTEARAG